jgi:SAM-dependent methyltransferase
MGRIVDWMDRTLYPDQGANWDDRRFREVVLETLRPEDALLDLGAGAGIVEAMDFRGTAARICGVDPDPRVAENPFLDEGRVGVGESIPYEDGAFDLVVADNVLEHLERPVEVFREVARVLRPGGSFLVKTPNARHYVPLIARLTPYRFHRFLNRLRGRREVDTFPTRYRANRPADLARHARAAGLELEWVERIEGRPEYLRFHPLAYALGWLYERAVNRIPGLADHRVLLVAELRKPLRGGAERARAAA